VTAVSRRTARLSGVAKLAAAVSVVVLVLVGIWISGGLITNDFHLAMALTALWMALAAVGVGLVAWWRPGLRVPVIGAYLLTAVVAAGYLGRSMFIDDEVNERVVRVTPTNVQLARGTSPWHIPPPAPRPLSEPGQVRACSR